VEVVEAAAVGFDAVDDSLGVQAAAPRGPEERGANDDRRRVGVGAAGEQANSCTRPYCEPSAATRKSVPQLDEPPWKVVP
jgi:hypothetical protein